MSKFSDTLNEHIEEALSAGVLPDIDPILEVEVPISSPGPQNTGKDHGPAGKRTPETGYPNDWGMPHFKSASQGTKWPPAMFSQQNISAPPAMFKGSTGSKGVAMEDEDREVLAAVFADLNSLSEKE